MTTTILEQPAIESILIKTVPGAELDEPSTLPAHDMRALGLAAAARSLGIRIADLGPIQVRRAEADLVHCPICPGHQVRASVAPALASAA